jgi:citrate lyase beta subunit
VPPARKAAARRMVAAALTDPRPDRAREVLAADGAALRLPDGEFVDLPVAQRAERLLARS